MGSDAPASPVQSLARPLRALFLATYFPKPDNPLIGSWALEQAQAILRQGVELRVVSMTSWVPRMAALTPGAKAYASCPSRHTWGQLPVDYPRWPFYSNVRPMRQWLRSGPQRQMRFAWRAARGPIYRAVKEHQPDVIYAHHTVPNAYIAARVRDDFGLPYVVTDHCFTEIEDCAEFPRRREFYAQTSAEAFRWVAVSARMEQTIRDLFPGARATTVFNGSDPIPPAFWGTPRPAELTDKLVVLSVGMFYERKGFPLLIEAFARIAAKHPTAILRILGSGKDRPAVEAAAARTGLGDRVQLLGYQPRERILQEMVWADVFALIGWDEPWGVVFSEAMAAGKPILCADDGGIVDVLRDGIHGLTVPPRDVAAAAEALDRLLSDDEGRRRMGGAAKNLLEQSLTWDANARAMVSIFRTACGK